MKRKHVIRTHKTEPAKTSKKEQLKSLFSSDEVAERPQVAEKEYKKDMPKDIITEKEAKEISKKIGTMKAEIEKVIIGQGSTVEKIMLTLMCDAHALLEGVPGLGKSLLVETLAKVISGTDFQRIQFLPDMLPADVIGGQIYNPKTATFKTIKGPIFSNFVLADEINRAPPKTHAALMECMQEKKVNIDKDTFVLDNPFLVLATMNPLENKGTYQLPEAVVDRFMFKIILDYPEREKEFRIISENATIQGSVINDDLEITSSVFDDVKAVMNKEEFLNLQRQVKNVYLSDRIKHYILDLVEASRGQNEEVESVKFVKYGAGVRASIYLGVASKANALMNGRNYVIPDDVMDTALPVLRHRIALNFRGKAHNISTDKIVEEILNKVNAV